MLLSQTSTSYGLYGIIFASTSLELFLLKSFLLNINLLKDPKVAKLPNLPFKPFVSCLIVNCRTCQFKHASMKIHDALMIRGGIFL